MMITTAPRSPPVLMTTHGPGLHTVVVDWTTVSDRASAEAVARRVTIIGRAIVEFGSDIGAYYRDHVIGGSGAFTILADGFARAVRRRLILVIVEVGGGAE